jgi:hypothetical protein
VGRVFIVGSHFHPLYSVRMVLTASGKRINRVD